MPRRTKIKKYIILTLSVILFGFNLLPLNFIVIAQEASQSAAAETPVPTPSENPIQPPLPTSTLIPIPTESITPTPVSLPSPTDSPAPTLTPILFPSLTPSLTPTSTATPTLTPSIFLEEVPTSVSSAAIKQPIIMRLISKKYLQAKQSLAVELANTKNNPFQVFLTREGERLNVSIKQQAIGDATVLIINPSQALKPGKYKIKVTDSTGHIEEEDFLWGVLAINTNKSIYLPQETAKIAMAVLDEQGIMVCDAKLKLIITTPTGGKDELSIENGKIIVNPECNLHDFTLKPDYEASYQTQIPGKYEMELTAETKNGSYSITDSFEVRDSVSFDVERLTATRVFPPVPYPVDLKIKANEDFDGEVIETVPEVFDVLPASGSGKIKSFDKVERINLPINSEIPNLGTSAAQLRLPFDGVYPVSLSFGDKPDNPYLQEEYTKFGAIGHDGVDFALPEKTPVLTIDDGQIIATDSASYGLTVVIKHSWGSSYYGHLSSTVASLNQEVKKGEMIGFSGDTGFSTGPHLHLALQPNDSDKNNGYLGKVDPAVYLKINPSEQPILVKQISWKLNLKKGDSITLGYQYYAPQISPQFYLLGPLQFIASGQPIFEEARQWQLAIDAPSNIFDNSTSAGGTYGPGVRRVVRTTNGTNGNRTFAVVYTTSGTTYKLDLYYTDNPEASSPTWTLVGNLITPVTNVLRSADMVWDESNNVLYIAYGYSVQANANNADINYRRVSSLDTTPSLGAQQTPIDGTLNGTTYSFPHIAIAGDQGTTKVFVFGNKASSGGSPAGFVVRTGTINSDTPTWDGAGPYTVKSWATTNSSGALAMNRMNTGKLVVFYRDDGTNGPTLATRHDDSSDPNTSSGWDALDGTDNSQTQISTDTIPNGNCSVVGMPSSDVVWFAWLDASYNINTRRWNGSSLDTEMTPVASTVNYNGPPLVTDGINLWMFYSGAAGASLDYTKLVFQTRSASDGTTAWSGSEFLMEDSAGNISMISSAPKAYQGKIDLIYQAVDGSNYDLRHNSTYKLAGNVYQESASSPYEGTTIWSGCDGSTNNLGASINGGTKINSWCSSSDGSFYFVLPQPTATDQDNVIFLDTAGGNKGALYTHNNDNITDVTGLTLYKDRVRIQSESSTSFTNADINTYDQTNDSDIPTASDGTNVTVDSGVELHINTSDTYTPGGNVTAPKLHIKGTYTGGSETLTLSGSGTSTCDATAANIRPLCIDSGTFTSSTNTTTFTGSSNSNIEATTYYDLTFNKASGTPTYSALGTITVSRDLTITGGTFSMGANTLNVARNWTNNDGFSSTGTVNLTGAGGSTQEIAGSTTFYSLSATTTSARTIKFTDGTTQTITNSLTFQGAASNLLTLTRKNTSSAWNINTTGIATPTLDYLDVSWSSSTLCIRAINSTNSGNNTNWDFTGAGCGAGPTTGQQMRHGEWFNSSGVRQPFAF